MKIFSTTNIRTDGMPINLVETDDFSRPIPSKNKVSLIALDYLGQGGNIQVNIYGNIRAPSLDSISSDKEFKDIKGIVEEIDHSDWPLPRTFYTTLCGKPLIVLNPDNQMNYFLLSFGRRYNPHSNNGLRVDYLGESDIIPYENRVILPDVTIKDIETDFEFMNDFLKADYDRGERHRRHKKNLNDRTNGRIEQNES